MGIGLPRSLTRQFLSRLSCRPKGAEPLKSCSRSREIRAHDRLKSLLTIPLKSVLTIPRNTQLDGSRTDRWLEVAAWMFDRTACPEAELLAAGPFVSIAALASLSAFLDLALKDRTPSTALLSGASRASHDQNRGESHVTCDDKLRPRAPTQSTIAPAASDRSVRERSEPRHRRARMAGATGGSTGGSHEPDDAIDRRSCCDDRDAARERGQS